MWLMLWSLPIAAWKMLLFFFFFNDTATTEIYTLSLHDALPICGVDLAGDAVAIERGQPHASRREQHRSEEHTSELQSLRHLVCRLLLEKKKNNTTTRPVRPPALTITGGPTRRRTPPA